MVESEKKLYRSTLVKCENFSLHDDICEAYVLKLQSFALVDRPIDNCE
jgi:hypothetical protein